MLLLPRLHYLCCSIALLLIPSCSCRDKECSSSRLGLPQLQPSLEYPVRVVVASLEGDNEMTCTWSTASPGRDAGPERSERAQWTCSPQARAEGLGRIEQGGAQYCFFESYDRLLGRGTYRVRVVGPGGESTTEIEAEDVGPGEGCFCDNAFTVPYTLFTEAGAPVVEGFDRGACIP